VTADDHSLGRRVRRRTLLPLLCALTLVVWAVLPLGSSGAPTNQQKLEEVQRQIQITQGKIGKRKGTERVLTSDIARWTARIRRLQGRIGTLQQRQSVVQASLDSAQGELERTQSELRFQRARQVRLRARLAQARRILSARLVERYRADEPDLVTVILGSKGFAELLERGEFLRRINEQDQRIIRLVRGAKQDARENAVRLDKLERRQAIVTARIAERRDEIAAVKQDLIDTRVGYDNTRAGKRNALMSVRGERHQLEGALSRMKKTQARIQAILNPPSSGMLPAGPIRGGSGSMVWPINGVLTSPFCERRSWESCHPGIDLAAPTGTPIRAADGGRVAIAGPTGGYGNYTCIQHSASLSTCYGHQSSIGVSVGQQVSKGQVIGAVGSTGFSTGPHLHFEVRINGAVTNPMAYL
jgi:murein DD-endopeptidase MepM/ murein hydrolase activator NlpD